MANSQTASSDSFYVYPTFPPSSLLEFNPFKNPPPLSPPIRQRSLAYPFNISPEVYHNALNVAVPITIALVYAVTVKYINTLNARRGYKPWAFSNTSAFFLLVVAHNVFLAVYSCWTFIGMLKAFQVSWPGIRNEYGAAGVADALCKLHGPRGLGSAAAYTPARRSWSIPNVEMRLAAGLPDTTDVGRIWNEGLAYYGWLFYLSKFYEVLDTAVILTKGKKTSFLQIYHHTGAMFAMYAGIRFMSPPIWMFTFINSLIHTFMYSYYTLSAFGVRVSPVLKKGLTAAQIFQIVFGASYAFAHLFIAYDIPASMPFRVANSLSTALPSAFDLTSSALSSDGDLLSSFKKAALRAAGQEGLAANVRNAEGNLFGPEAIRAEQARRAQEEIVYKSYTSKTHCLDTSGEVFAIGLNILYLVPLAYLFVRFFAGYFKKDTQRTDGTLSRTRNSANRAVKDVAGEISEAMKDQQGGDFSPEINAKLEQAKSDAVSKTKDLKSRAQPSDLNEKVQNLVASDLEKLKARAHQGAQATKDKLSGIKKEATEGNDVDGAASVKQEDGKSSEKPAAGETKATEGESDNKPTDNDDSGAYEVNPDELLDGDEKKADAKRQPNGT